MFSIESSIASITYVLISPNRLVNISRREFIQLLVVTEYNYCDIDRTEYRKFVRLLEQTPFSFQKSPKSHQHLQPSGVWAIVDAHGTIAIILYSLDLDLPSTHDARNRAES